MPPLRFPTSISEPSASPVDVIKKEFNEGARIASFFRGMNAAGLDGAGMMQPHPKSEVKESTSVDLGAAFRAMTDHSTALTQQLISVSQGTKSGPQDTYMQHLIDELKEMRRQLADSQRQPKSDKDPTQVMMENMVRYNEMMQGLQKHLQLPGNVAVTADNANLMVELKKLELQMADRQYQFEVERAERSIERDMNQARFNVEMQLKKEELQGQLERSSAAAGGLQDLIGALAQSIDRNPQPVAAQPPVRTQSYMASSMPCGGCGQKITIPNPPPAVLECPDCHMSYRLGDDAEPVLPSGNGARPLQESMAPEVPAGFGLEVP